MSLSKRLKELRKQINKTQEELGKIINAPRQRITDLETGKVKNIKGEELQILEELYDVNPLWLSVGKGNMFKSQNTIIGVHGVNNGNISINTSTFNHSGVIKEIIELLAFAPPAYLDIIKNKLEEFKKMSEK